MRKCYDPPSHLSTGENGNWNRWVLSITFLIIISFSVTQSKVHISIRVKIFTQFTEKIKCDPHKFSVLFCITPKHTHVYFMNMIVVQIGVLHQAFRFVADISDCIQLNPSSCDHEKSATTMEDAEEWRQIVIHG